LQLLAGDTGFPFRLQYEQYKLVRLLRSRLAELPGAEIRFRSRVTGLRQADDRVELAVEGPEGPSSIRASFVCGADGASSTVRKVLDVGFDGLTYEDRFLLLSTTFPFEQHLPDIRHVNYIADPDEYMMLLRIPDVWRVLFSVRPGEEDVALDPAEGERRLQRVVASATPYDVVQRQIYKVHQRVAGRFRVGRVLLLGDAAHVNSPFGGMGLNSGVHDAFDLARRLARIISEGAGLDELDAFASVRREFAVDHVQSQTHQNTTSLAERDPDRRRENQAAMAALASDPVRAREWLLDAAMLRHVREHGIGEPVDRARHSSPKRRGMNILIAGAGVGGLSTALSLEAMGVRDLRIVEAVKKIRPLGIEIATRRGVGYEMTAESVAWAKAALEQRLAA
jgi:2-polyprenyl-6-methoxyphenol hydroxylase-like FAD-dependent oxidoreductase